MAGDELLKPTLHVEILLKSATNTSAIHEEIRQAVTERLVDDYAHVQVGQAIHDFSGMQYEEHVAVIEIVDYTGPVNPTGFYNLQSVQLDVQAYALKNEHDAEARRSISQSQADETQSQARILALPNVALHEEWNSLVFEDALPARLLRYLVRMVSMMRQPELNLAAFNWNRLCLLHGPPGSGKSTLCRALAQKLSIRLRNVFGKAMLIEINANAMLSKYFGESGKLIHSTFERVHTLAQDRSSLICVVMDEVETIAGSREKSTSGMECNDGLRATNQLLTALDHLRNLPNVIVLCTSNLLEAIDPAFLDRVDIKQLIPSPSPAAIYNIFRSCLNELVRSSLIDAAAVQVSSSALTNDQSSSAQKPASAPAARSTRARKAKPTVPAPSSSSSPGRYTVISQPALPSFSSMQVTLSTHPNSSGARVWKLAEKCHGFSGRTLRRLPILGLAMYTWGGDCSLHDAVSALEAAVEQEIIAVRGKKADIVMGGL